MKHFLKFSKYHGRGNDFILIDDQNKTFSHSKQFIEQLCHRHFGIGADGIILLQKSEKADLRMRIFNCDGNEASSCGNGLLCLLTFARDQKILDKYEISIETMDRIVYAQKQKDLYSINMGAPLRLELNHKLALSDREILCHLVDTGVYHAVVFVDDLEKTLVEKIGKEIREHKDFSPGGINVNFVQRKKTATRVRTYEKGVEAETLSCGTGACAVGVVSTKLYNDPNHTISFSKGDLSISYAKDTIHMKGSATFIFSGIY